MGHLSPTHSRLISGTPTFKKVYSEKLSLSFSFYIARAVRWNAARLIFDELPRFAFFVRCVMRSDLQKPNGYLPFDAAHRISIGFHLYWISTQ